LDADSLPEPLNRPEIRLAMEVLRKMSHNTIEREIYEGRLKAARDQWAFASEIERLTSEVGHLTSEVGYVTSEVGHLTSEVGI
jgi:hypothetical protein